MYVGTYTGDGSEGIYAYRFDPETGETDAVGLVAATENPSLLEVDPNGRSLYLDTSSRCLMVATYNGGNVAVFLIGNDGRLGRHSGFVQEAGSSVNQERQAGPHARFIQVANDNRFAIAADLGLDTLLVHRFDAATGTLTPAKPGNVALETNGSDASIESLRHDHGSRDRGGCVGQVSVRVEPRGRQYCSVRHRPAGKQTGVSRVGSEWRQDAAQLRDRPDRQMVARDQPKLEHCRRTHTPLTHRDAHGCGRWRGAA